MSSPTSELDEITAALRQFVREREWEPFHDPKNLSMLIASEAGELLAEYRWTPNAEADAFSREPATRERIAHEVADVAIAVLLLCDRLGIDLYAAVRAKIAMNAVNYPADIARGRAERPASENSPLL